MGVGNTKEAIKKINLNWNKKKSFSLQRNGAWAIRNMVSRSREQCAAFLSHGAEDVLNAALATYSDISYDIKSALRDLGCEVELREEWKGIKNKISIQD